MDYDVTPAALGCHVSRRVCRRSNLAGRSDSIQNIFAENRETLESTIP